MSKGLREDIRRATYAKILDAAPVGDRGALRDARGPKAETVLEHEAAVGRKICRVFTCAPTGPLVAATRCERCAHPYNLHRMKWYA